MNAILHKINNSENSKTEDEILSTANEILQILITDVEDLLRSIGYKSDLNFEDLELDYTDRQFYSEINQNMPKSTERKTGLPSEQPVLSIIEGQINCEIKWKDLQRHTGCKAGSLIGVVKSDLKFVGQVTHSINHDDLSKSSECKINLNFKQCDLNFSGVQINCNIIDEDFPKSTECPNNLTSEQPDSKFLEGYMKCEIRLEDLLRISEITSNKLDLSELGQINCKFNLETIKVVSKWNIGHSSEQLILNVEGGQINCDINLEDLLRVADDKTSLTSDQPDSIIIGGQISCERIEDDLLGVTECKIDLRIDQPGLNVEGQIKYNMNMKNLLKSTECKTGLSSEQLDLNVTEDQMNCEATEEDLRRNSISFEESDSISKINQDFGLLDKSFGDF